MAMFPGHRIPYPTKSADLGVAPIGSPAPKVWPTFDRGFQWHRATDQPGAHCDPAGLLWLGDAATRRHGDTTCACPWLVSAPRERTMLLVSMI